MHGPVSGTYTWEDVEYFYDSNHVVCDSCPFLGAEDCDLLAGTAEPGTKTTPEWCAGIEHYADELEEAARRT